MMVQLKIKYCLPITPGYETDRTPISWTEVFDVQKEIHNGIQKEVARLTEEGDVQVLRAAWDLGGNLLWSIEFSSFLADSL